MAQKIKLGQRPTSFKRVVTFPMLDGSTGAIEMEYRYRTRSEFGAFIDAEVAGAGDRPLVDADGKPSMAAVMERSGEANAEYVMKIAAGWNLDDPFTAASLAQLNDEIPAAMHAIIENYRAAITEGRLGN